MRLATRVVSIGAVIALLVLTLGVSAVSADAESSTYLVLYSSSSVPSGAAKAITAAGGSVVARYGAIGVVIANSSASTFASKMTATKGVAGVSATASFGVQLKDDWLTEQSADDPVPAPGSDSEPLSGLQWDMTQIHAFEAHDISGGSPNVVVGDIDTGLDFTHPDLAPNYDATDSADCTSGAPAPLSVGNDGNGHGTHTAGTIAAAVNGIGITGVAPNVKIAGIKAGNTAGFFFPEAVICAFMWAGDHHVAVTNNSYFADPWEFNCKNDPVQRAIWTAERRALSYAQGKGVVVVAAEGNTADDLAHPTMDSSSPDDTTAVSRAITNACAIFPTEAPGVVGVTATGNLGLKSFYSSYGVGAADVAAPGGDSVLQLTPAAANGRVLSTWPAALAANCARKVIDVSGAVYCYQQGTSMAAPHVAGVAALIKSAHPGWSGGAVAATLQNTADGIPCPTDLSIYNFFPSVDNGAPQVCTGDVGYNSFYGHGQVNALSAVSH